jgi:hypothetical protein
MPREPQHTATRSRKSPEKTRQDHGQETSGKTMGANRPTEKPVRTPRCAHCGLDVAMWRTEVGGRLFCTWHCARAATTAEGA